MQKGVKDGRGRALAVACGPHGNYSCHRKLCPSVRVVAGPVFLLGKRIQSRGGSMALALNIGKCTLLGNYRENNEDSIDVKQFPDMTVCLVADGMGGQAAGEIASKRAVEIVPRELKKRLSSALSLDDNKASIRRSIVQANEEIM